MITIDTLVTQVSGLERQDLDRWISNQWVKPDGQSGSYIFQDVDVARVHLIVELRDVMEINETALPVVLSLLDQLYDHRRWMRQLRDAVSQVSPVDARQVLTASLDKPTA